MGNKHSSQKLFCLHPQKGGFIKYPRAKVPKKSGRHLGQNLRCFAKKVAAYTKFPPLQVKGTWETLKYLHIRCKLSWQLDIIQRSPGNTLAISSSEKWLIVLDKEDPVRSRGGVLEIIWPPLWSTVDDNRHPLFLPMCVSCAVPARPIFSAMSARLWNIPSFGLLFVSLIWAPFGGLRGPI